MSRTDPDQLATLLALEFTQLREALSGPLGQFANGLTVSGARPVQLSRLTSSPLLWAGNGRLMGWSVISPGGPGTIRFYDSRDGSGDVLGVAAVLADADDTRWLGTGVSIGEALSATVTGPVAGVVYIRD